LFEKCSSAEGENWRILQKNQKGSGRRRWETIIGKFHLHGTAAGHRDRGDHPAGEENKRDVQMKQNKKMMKEYFQ